jgi:undecaprenyl-diphosphatase
LPLFAVSSVLFAMLAEEMHDDHLNAFDGAVASAVVGLRGKLDGVMLAATRGGEFRWMAASSVVAVCGLALLKKRREAAFVATCALSALALSLLLKLIFHRARPADAGYLIALPGSFSFPSGHAMASTSILGSFAVVALVLLPRPWRWLAVACAVVFASLVGASRIYFGVHYPSDVLGGQLASAAIIAAATGWFYPRLLPGEETEVPAPVEDD